MTDRPIYLDTNATTPVDPRVAAAMQPYLTDHFGNPSSGHDPGQACRAAVETARRQLAALLGARSEEIVFTSGGTEANNAVLAGIAERAGHGAHFVVSAVEHPAILNPCRWLEDRRGIRVTVVPVDGHGRVDPADVEAAMTPRTALVSVMHANNEVGTLQPVRAIADIAHAGGALMHTDAAQSLGKVAVDVDALGVDFLSVAGHKFYAPKGVGALYIRAGVELASLLHGAGQERGRRAGTENVLAIVGLGAAAEIAGRELGADAAHSRALRDRLWTALRAGIPDLRLHGHPEERLPNTLSVAIVGIEAGLLVVMLGDRVAMSAGAACHAGAADVSTVLQAMGVPEACARGTIRLSVGRMTTAAEVDRAAGILVEAVAQARRPRAPSARAT
ncbi:MAG: cysteine desulfurase [Planctomycetes bacterium]|nr:cysteine desulfurase [Planctomycetota bacterium]